MKVTLKLLTDYGEFKAGALIQVAEDDVKTMIDGGNAEKYVPQITIEKATEQAGDLLKTELEKAVKTLKLPNVEMVTDENDKTVYAKGEGGLFFKDVRDYSCGKDTSEKMTAWMAKAPSGQNTLIDSEGGFLIPDEFSTMILNAAEGAAVIAPRCTNIPINSRIKLPFVVDTDKSASWFGGVQVTWGQEGATLTPSKLKFGQVELALNKVHALVHATDELMDDSAVALESFISQAAGVALAKEFDDQIVVGTGAGRPQGIINAAAVIEVAKVASQTATTFNYANARAMWERVAKPNTAVWLMNRDVLSNYYTFEQEVGTAGGAVLNVTNVREKLPEVLFGAPIIVTEHCKTLGTVGDVILANLDQYLTATKAGGPMIKSASSIHVKFLTDEISFRFTQRVDGKSWWKTAQTPKNGTNTVSPFVTLATRA